MSYFSPYKYIKDESENPIYKPVSGKFVFRMAVYPVVFFALGLFFLLTQVLIPLVVFTTQDVVTRPVQSTVLGVASGFKEFEFSELQNDYGSTRPANVPEFYYLTVPKLGIKNARVDSAPPDLDPEDALGHYIGSSYPGDVGNTFIYGHSVLPAFYNPKNYKTIFSTLYRLSVGDTFTIEYNNKTLTYKIDEKRTLYPEDVYPLKGFKPAYLNESTVTLMTCSPAGTKIKRLLINATLVN
jgi:LPXTG-site transpeptidase (sortase) family protein